MHIKDLRIVHSRFESKTCVLENDQQVMKFLLCINISISVQISCRDFEVEADAVNLMRFTNNLYISHDFKLMLQNSQIFTFH